jgi:hypothetical protein
MRFKFSLREVLALMLAVAIFAAIANSMASFRNQPKEWHAQGE